MIGIEFNGKHSFKHYGITVAPGKVIGRPSKQKNKRKPAHSNKEWDYSRIYGGETYSNRVLRYPFNLISKSKISMELEAVEIINWLMNSDGKQPLHDDTIPGYHFLAEVEEGVDPDLNWTDGILTVTFDAYPFMIKDVTEGSPYWDDYTILDRYQETNFDVSGSKNITIYNDGAEIIIPQVTATSEMEVVKGNRTFRVPDGTSESYDLFLVSGENEMEVKGNGSITFLFRKELI